MTMPMRCERQFQAYIHLNAICSGLRGNLGFWSAAKSISAVRRLSPGSANVSLGRGRRQTRQPQHVLQIQILHRVREPCTSDHTHLIRLRSSAGRQVSLGTQHSRGASPLLCSLRTSMLLLYFFHPRMKATLRKIHAQASAA